MLIMPSDSKILASSNPVERKLKDWAFWWVFKNFWTEEGKSGDEYKLKP